MLRVLAAIADLHERSIAGRTGVASRDLLVDAEAFLASLDAADGTLRQELLRELQDAHRHAVLHLELHPHDPGILERIRFPLANEPRLYQLLGRPSPSRRRTDLAAQFARAASNTEVPERWRTRWIEWCQQYQSRAATGASVAPFLRDPDPANADLLALLPRLLAWEGESLVRFASCLLCRDSKQLESLATPDRSEPHAPLRGKLGRLLADITSGEVSSLEDLGILPNPRFALVHGPLQVRFDSRSLDLGLLHGPFRLSYTDLSRAPILTTTARRCLTIENEASFHEIAKLLSGELLVHTSFPGRATIALLQALPDHLEWWHFGDSDPAGFEILRVLRERSGRPFLPLHMDPDQPHPEQESLGRPSLPWPFYHAPRP